MTDLRETRRATIRMTVTITFVDNGEDDLNELATEQLMMDAPSNWDDSIEVEKIIIEPQEQDQ